MKELWFIVYTFGEMKMNDVLAECQKQSWVPILNIKFTNGNVIIPCFQSQPTAIKFARRNLPKNHLFGCAKFLNDDLAKVQKEWVEGRGWFLEVLTHPKLLRDLGTFDVEIHYYPEKPDIYGVWGRETMTNIKPISIGHN